MKCNNCGFEKAEDFNFCPNCGQSSSAFEQPHDSGTVQEQTVIKQPVTAKNSIAEKMLALFNDTFFLVICILQSASVLFSFCCSDFSVLSVLFTIFLWIVFTQSRKNVVDTKYMRSISGTIFAKYVINWVVCGILAFFGILFTVLFSFISASGLYIFDRLQDELVNRFGEHSDILFKLFSVGGVVIGIILIIAAVVVAIINIFATRSFHRFAQSLYQSSENGEIPVVKKNTAQIWFLIIGIIQGVSALSSVYASPFKFLSLGCIAAIYIFAYLLTKKYFSDINA